MLTDIAHVHVKAELVFTMEKNGFIPRKGNKEVSHRGSFLGAFIAGNAHPDLFLVSEFLLLNLVGIKIGIC